MSTKIDIITLGVANRERALQFYEDALGGTAQAGEHSQLITFGGRASKLALGDWNAVAAAAEVDPQSIGFRSFTLSYIVDSADAVDAVLERARLNGGTVSKPPKNAVWGYSAYVTDPDGYLWKIASSKRKPLLGRKPSSPSNGHAITPTEVPITIGVADMGRSKRFYEDGLGLAVKKAFGSKFVMFSGGERSSDLGMYKREALADDAAVAPAGAGFHGFTITHVVDSAQRVDDLLATAEHAGGKILKRPADATAREYGGYFADLDGNVWQIAFRR